MADTHSTAPPERFWYRERLLADRFAETMRAQGRAVDVSPSADGEGILGFMVSVDR